MNTRHALATARLDLVPAVEEHAELTWPLLNEERMWEFFPLLRPPTKEALRHRYQRWSYEMPYPGAPERWENWICMRRTDDAPIGEAQATYTDTTVYIAYAIFVPFQRKGFAHEAMCEILDHAGDVHRCRTAIAEMAAGNRASVALAEALGFKRVVVRRNVEPGHGYRGDEYVYQREL
jgi:ribosomal-protein-alanine N-acetyltransferase